MGLNRYFVFYLLIFYIHNNNLILIPFVTSASKILSFIVVFHLISQTGGMFLYLDCLQLVDLPQKKWEATVKHALTCQLDDKIYCSIHSEENTRIVFNAIGKVLGLIIQNKYFPLDTLSHEHKVPKKKSFFLFILLLCDTWLYHFSSPFWY